MRVINGDPVPSDSTSTAVSPQEQALIEMLMDPLRNPNMSGRVENTFGPIDYIAGAFPIGRVLAPYAAKVMNALGLGEDAGVNLAQAAFSNRFGRGAKSQDRGLMRELRKTAGDRQVINQQDPYMGYQIPTTQEVMGIAKAAPPQPLRGVGGGASARQAEQGLANEMEDMAVTEMMEKFINDPILLKDRKSAIGKAAFYDEPYSMLEESAIEAAEGVLYGNTKTKFPNLVRTDKSGRMYVTNNYNREFGGAPKPSADKNFAASRETFLDQMDNPQRRMNEAVRVVKDVEGDVLEQLNRAYRRQGQ
jgi:hypothetical protein